MGEKQAKVLHHPTGLAKFGLVNGFIFIALGILFNPWMVAQFFCTVGKIQAQTKLLIWILEILLIGWGLTSILYRKQEIIKGILVFQFSSLVFAPLFCEICLQCGIYFGISFFQQPRFYLDAYSNEEFYKLRVKWNNSIRTEDYPSLELIKQIRHPLLGWAPEITNANPLGIVAESPYTPEFHEKTVLFFGDSYVEGFTKMSDKLPQQLDRLLPDHVVYNYGVAGYDVGQIYLRFMESHSQFQKPIILFGILTEDIDRSIFSFRDNFKPYFVVDHGVLLLKGVPVDTTTDPKEWLSHYSPNIKSYLWAMITQRYRIFTGSDGYGNLRQDEKKEVNSLLIKATIEEAQKHGLQLMFVLFYRPEELRKRSWRAEFLKEQFEQLSASYIDTKQILLSKAEQDSIPISALFNTGHPSALANKIIAEAIAKQILQLQKIQSVISYTNSSDIENGF